MPSIHTRIQRVKAPAAVLQTGFLAISLWLAGTLACLPQRAYAQPSAAQEYQVKAGFLTAFAQYVTWPQSTFSDTNSPILLGVLGTDPFGEVLTRTAREQKGPRPLEVRRIRTVEEAAKCHVVFISQAETRSEAAWLEALKEKPVLTVGESGDTINRGGVLEFVIVDDRVRFDADWAAMERAGLKIATPMLKSARNVHHSPRPKT